MVATTEQIRASFPALERVHEGYPVAYFDGPAGTQVPRQVADAITEYLLTHNANQHWNYPTSVETDAVIAGGREAMADLLGASPDEIAFGPNMTTLTFHLSRALGRDFGPDDEIVVTELDHHANVAPWQSLHKECGVTVRTVKFETETGRLDWEDLERNLSPHVRLLAIGLASNALGTITDVGRAIEMARSVGAMVFVDAVHHVPHAMVDVHELGCDFLSCSVYKFYGPHIGVLYGRRELLEEIDVPKLIPAPDGVPQRFESGTLNHEGIAGVTAAVDYLASLAKSDGYEGREKGTLNRRERLSIVYDALHERGAELITRLWDGLSDIDKVTLYGPGPGTPRTPTLSFTVGDIPSAEVSAFLAGKGIFATNGDFYARSVVERLGKLEQGLVRAGCACYTTMDEIERLTEAVGEI